MTTEQRIEKYYLDRINKYSSELGKAIETIFGGSFKVLYEILKDGFKPTIVASRRGIEYHLGNTPTKEEEEIMEYLLERMTEEGRESVLISSQSDYEKKHFNDFFNGDRRHLSYYNVTDGRVYSHYKMDVFCFRDGLCLDIQYINGLLYFLLKGFDVEKRVWKRPFDSFSVKCDIEYANEKIYFRILNTVAIQIVSLLRQKHIYLLDDQEDDYDLEHAIGRFKMVNPKFISMFQDLIPTFLFNPKSFIENVGEDNFKDFTICSLDVNSDLDIDEVIDNMRDERNCRINDVVSFSPAAIFAYNRIILSKIQNGSYEPIIPVDDLELLDMYVQMDVEILKEDLEHNPINNWPRSDGFKYYLMKYLENTDAFKKNAFGGLFDVSKRGIRNVSWLGYVIENTPKEELQEDLKNGFFDGESDAVIYCLNKYANSSYDYPKVYPDINFQLDNFEILEINSYIENYSVDELKIMLKDGKLKYDSFAVRYYVRKYIKYGESFEMPKPKNNR